MTQADTVQEAGPKPASIPARPARLSRRRSRLIILHTVAILAVALVVRLAYWGDARAYAIGGDEPDYVIPAQTLVRDGEYVDTFITPGRTWTRVPLTSLVFAGAFLFVPDSAAAQAAGDDAALMEPRYDAVNMVQIVASLLTVLVIMLLAARAFPAVASRAAPIAGYIAALYPPLASSPAQRALSEPLSILLVFAAILTLTWWSPALPVRRAAPLAGTAGLLLGLGALARPQALLFVPFVWLWLWTVTRRAETPSAAPRRLLARFPVLSAVVVPVVALLAIAPWTLYNYTHYGRFLLLDTASATAYWNYHNFRGEDITARMWALPNPADRLSLIVQEGTANILEYPDRALRGTVFAFFYFWHLETNSAVLENPWDMTQRDPDVPDLLHSDAAFIVVGLLGLAGLVFVGIRRPDDPAGRTLLLLNLWLLAMVLLGLVVPYDGRYRLPAVPSLIVPAAGLLALGFARPTARLSRSAVWRGLALALLFAWVAAGAYSPNILPAFSSMYHAWRGDGALGAGDVDTAFGRYSLAQQVAPTFYWPYRHAADMARRQGEDDRARDLYAQALTLHSDDPYGILGLADLAARRTDWTLTPQEEGWLARGEENWRGNPWNSFKPSHTAEVDIGSGRDHGYVLGFHPLDRPSPDLDYRWSMGRSRVRIPVPAESTSANTFSAVRLTMSAPAVGLSEAVPVTISINGAQPTTIDIPVGWADYTLPLPSGAGKPGETITLGLTSPARTPAELEPGSRDDRNLGVGVARVVLVAGNP